MLLFNVPGLGRGLGLPFTWALAWARFTLYMGYRMSKVYPVHGPGYLEHGLWHGSGYLVHGLCLPCTWAMAWVRFTLKSTDLVAPEPGPI